MGLFDKLFGKSKKKTTALNLNTQSNANSKKSKENKFITNSSQLGFGEIELGISGKIRVDGILAISALEKVAKERNLDFDFAVMYTTLLEEGALTVPVVVSMGEEKYSIYFIYQEEDMLKYLDLKNHVKKTNYPNLIYFSSIPISTTYKPKKIIEPFQLADLRFEKDAKISGMFAMWWKSDDDNIFHQSKTFEYLSKTNEIFKGYETYLLGYVLRQTRIVQETQLKRMRLPEQTVNYIIHAPENKKILLSVSQEKGIRFLFPIQSTTKEYRERFLKGAMVDFLANRIPLQKNNFPLDEQLDPNSYDWFNFMTNIVKQKEQEGESIDVIGGLSLNVQMN